MKEITIEKIWIKQKKLTKEIQKLKKIIRK